MIDRTRTATPITLRACWAGALALLLAGRALPPAAQALPDPKNPSVALFERPPGVPVPKPAATDAVFPDLVQDAKGYWLIDFGHLASFLYTVSSPIAAPPPAQTPTGSAIGKPVPMFQADPPSSQTDAAQPPSSPNDIPATVRALEGRRVCVSGYMLPISLGDDGLTRNFLIIRSPLVCCFGIAPAPNEWVVVTMAKGTAPIQDVPLKFYGTLHVGATYESGVFTGLYRLDGERVEAATP